ncbi:hypothetical protein [Bradyrhizobium sp. Ai1a-2]|uniref:hypothetical protein n=1 Tax=Bradyrhizobium sp. Ai1a-2 TaxID=196490 RepID=UPI000415C1DB|nr:hypothetical protein [Bradyrhizobium sp. Ai1a-2]
MHVRVTQIDGALPNLALMRLAAHHRTRGDQVHFTRRVRRELFEPPYDVVYGSAIFKFSADRLARFMNEFPGAIVGGTGTDSTVTVERLIGDAAGLDYSLYPDFEASIGFTQRGCRLSCKFCVVPTKEGKPRQAATIAQVWRGGSTPKHLHLLDNDFFGQPDWQGRIAEIRDGGFKVCFSQGINVRAMTSEVAAAVAGVEYRCNEFRRRRLYTAWDNLKDEEVFFHGVDILEAAGVPAKHLMAYMLVGFDKRETWERIHHRFNRMVERGILPYPMPFDQARRDLKRFQRWAVTGLYRSIPFSEYDANLKAKRTAKRRRGDGDLFGDVSP